MGKAQHVSPELEEEAQALQGTARGHTNHMLGQVPCADGGCEIRGLGTVLGVVVCQMSDLTCTLQSPLAAAQEGSGVGSWWTDQLAAGKPAVEQAKDNKGLDLGDNTEVMKTGWVQHSSH